MSSPAPRITIWRTPPPTAVDKASSAIRLRAAVNRRPMLAEGYAFAELEHILFVFAQNLHCEWVMED